MGLILNDLKNACELEHVCDYVNNRTTSSMNYISTENMLPNKGGISESTIIPPGTTTEYKIGDILISNIRPYFQKIWCADRCGGCSADVLCIRAKENTDSKYLYYLLSQQAFFEEGKFRRWMLCTPISKKEEWQQKRAQYRKLPLSRAKRGTPLPGFRLHCNMLHIYIIKAAQSTRGFYFKSSFWM